MPVGPDRCVELRLEVSYTTSGKSEKVIEQAKKLVLEIAGLVEDLADGFVTPVGGFAMDENDEKVEIYRDTPSW